VYGRLDPTNGEMTVYDAPRGPGPYGIAATASGHVYYVSLAGSYLAWIEPESAAATVIEPPTPRQGARRVWPDSLGRLWISEWNAGQLSRFTPLPEDPTTGEWRVWKLPGSRPQAYAVYVDDLDHVWVTDWGANALLRFDPETETFESFPHPRPNAQVRQLLGRPAEVWAALSAQDKLMVMRRT
jgi:virginiamycin B lyase